MARPNVAMLVIGDELLNGRTQDTNLAFAAKTLDASGFVLNEARFVRDTKDGIVNALTALSASHDHVLTSGGIGPTHDDITADCVAAAHGVGIDVRDDARAVLAAYYAETGRELTETRLRMARIPDTATLIDNPASGAPGFSITSDLGTTHVMAGVPRVFQAMLTGLLKTLEGGQPRAQAQLTVHRGESDIAAELTSFAANHPELDIGSYPFERGGRYGAELVIRGEDHGQVVAARDALVVVFGADGEASD